MPDADDFDVEELRKLLRGEGGPQPAKAPEAAPRAPAAPKAPKKAARPVAGRPKKPGAGRRQPPR